MKFMLLLQGVFHTQGSRTCVQRQTPPLSPKHVFVSNKRRTAQTDVLSFDRTGVPLPPENLMIQNLFVPFVVQKRQDQLIIASVLSQ